MEPPSEIWSLWVNRSETTAYTARDNEVIVADLSPKVKLLNFNNCTSGVLRIVSF
jgi:hypothetical protein